MNHRHDAGLQGLGQVGPCFDYGGQVGVGSTGVVRQMIGNGRGGLTQVVVRHPLGASERRSHNPPSLTRCGFDHGHDAGFQGLGQVGPCFDHGGQIGVILEGVRYYANAGSATGSAQTPGRVGNGRIGTG